VAKNDTRIASMCDGGIVIIKLQ